MLTRCTPNSLAATCIPMCFCRAELVQQNYFHAVLEAAKSIAEKLRDISGLDGDGAVLVDGACSLSSGPIVAFNTLSTEWDKPG